MKKFLVLLLVIIPLSASAEHVYKGQRAVNQFVERLYKHYEVDDSINGYLVTKIKKGVTLYGSDDTPTKFPALRTSKAPFKQKVVLKNKNKMIYTFARGHILELNPSKLNSITHRWKWDNANKQSALYTNVSDDGFQIGYNLSW